MPLTPFHLGPGLFFGIIFIKYLDFFAFLLGNVILDIEPFFVILLHLGQPYSSYSHHGALHSLFGALVISLATAFLLNRFKKRIGKILAGFNILHASSFRKIFLSVFLGTLMHLLFDSLMHYDVFPFWPFHFNPLLRKISFTYNYFLIIALGILGFALLVLKIKKNHRTS